MNNQSDKLQLIKWIVSLKDSTILEELKKLQNQNLTVEFENELKPMSIEDLEKRAEASNKAIVEGQVSDIDSIVNEDWDN